MKKMKNLYYLVVALLAISFTSCQDEDHGVEVNNFEGNVAYFTSGTEGEYFVTPNADPYMIQIGATNKSDSDRTYTILISPESTATVAVDFSTANTVTIPAGEYFGEIAVEGLFAGTTASGSELILSIQGDSSDLAMVNNSFSLGIFQKCVSDLGGNYSVTTTYGYHDFLPDYNPNTMDMEIVVLDQDEGLYEINDFSGGLYSVGPYADAYSSAGPDSFIVQFTENCGNISWTGQSDPYGACVPLSGGVNSVDFASGEVTISWFCERWGESGVSVYTRI
jgi:hypothetical protein